ITGHPLSISQPPYTDATFNGGKTEKTKHTRRFIISKLRSCGKNREFLLTPHSPAFVPPEARPSRPFIFTLCPSFPQLFAAGKKAPALFGKKWTESDRRRRENDATRTSPAAGEGEHPEVPQEFYGNYADPADRVRSLPDLVPLLGGDRWSCTNLAHDVVAAVLYLPAIGVMIHNTNRNSFCNLPQYMHPCLYKVYLTAAVFACFCWLAYLLSVIFGACRKCQRG
uniref:Uncharacterized protein n=1 Tax=Astatotilapia calliptera TaxID=8154 RepID=A0AAX7SL95_ASTCA